MYIINIMHLEKRKVRGKTYYCIVEKRRINGKVKTIKQIYVGSAERIVRLLTEPLPKFVSYSYGEIALLMHIAEITEFVNITDNHLRKITSIGDHLLLPIINRLIKPESKAGIKEWYEKSCLPLIWDGDVYPSSQNYWYYLGRLNRDKMKIIWKEVVLNIKKKLNVEDSTFLFDPTNFYTYISDHEGNILPRKGHSKQKRNDKNQLALSLFVGENSELPYDYNCYPGNIHDSKHTEAILPEAKEKLRLYGKENVTLVFDKGNNSHENFKALENFFFVSSLPKDKAESHDLLSGTLNECYVNSQKNQIYSVSEIKNVYGMKCKIVVSFNEKLKEKQLHAIENGIQKTLAKFGELKNHMYENQKAGLKVMLGILPKRNDVLKYDVVKEDERWKIKIAVDEEKLVKYKQGAGKNIIFTNHIEWSDERIIRTYRAMYRVENHFKILHGALFIPIKPVYHWTDQKIEAHIFLCMVALLFAKTLEYICKGRIRGDFRDILDFASSIRIALVQRENKPELVFENLDPTQQRLMEEFSLGRFARK